jgi:futalosine hydrolase
MNCLLVAATVGEIAPFLDHYRNSNKSHFVDFDIDILITGVGLTATSYQLTRHFCIKKPDLAVQAGIGGSFDKRFLPGSVVAIKKDTIADEMVIESKKLLTKFDLKLAPPNQFPYSKGWLANPYKNMLKRTGLKAATAISINQVSTDSSMIKLYQKKFKPGVESMEGAAFHYCSLMANVPFLQIRGISNRIGERDKKNWKMKDSIYNLNQVLVKLFENL